MAKFRKRPVVIEAIQWFKMGDHNKVEPFAHGRDIRECHICGKNMRDHGWVPTLEGGHIVCPNDWIITGVHGEHYPCKPDIFAKTYEEENGQ